MEIKRARYQVKKPKMRMNKALIFGICLFVLSVGGYSYAAVTKPLPTLQPHLSQLSPYEGQKVTLSWPAGQGAVGTPMDGVLITSGNESIQPIASMTKLITALAILEKQPLEQGDLGKTYTITQADVNLYRNYVAKFGSVMPVRLGQELSQYHALQGLLLPSANNIADTLVINEFGSMDAYITYANEMVKQLGTTHTTVADASGFSPQTVSTPTDMIRLGSAALANPVIAEIVAQREAQIPGSGTIRNTNLLLADDGMIGLKTGTTDEAGSCLLYAYEEQVGEEIITVVGVVMGVPTWPQLYRAVRTLVEETKTKFQTIELIPADTVVGYYEAPWGERTELITSDPLTVQEWIGLDFTLEAFADPIDRLPTTGDPLGSVVTYQATTVPLEATNTINPPSIWWRLANYW